MAAALEGLGLMTPLVRDGEISRHGTPRVRPGVVRQFIANGLGPMLHELAARGRIRVDHDSADNLAGSDLAAMAIHDRTVASLKRTLGSLNDLGIRPVLLKGACFAPRYYPKAHWRAMADIDILVAPKDIERTDRMLREEGFHNPSDKPSSAWDDHHHLAPLFHPDLRLWVEVHRRLFRGDSPFAGVPVFEAAHVLEVCTPVRAYDADVLFLPDELNLTYLACHWYWTLMAGVGPQSARAVIDAALLLNGIREAPLEFWVTEDAPGTAVAVLLLTLIQQRLIESREEDLWKCLGSRRNERARRIRFLAALVRRRVVSVKSVDNLFAAQLMGDWFRTMLDPTRPRGVLITVAGATASKLGGLLKHKVRGLAAE